MRYALRRLFYRFRVGLRGFTVGALGWAWNLIQAWDSYDFIAKKLSGDQGGGSSPMVAWILKYGWLFLVIGGGLWFLVRFVKGPQYNVAAYQVFRDIVKKTPMGLKYSEDKILEDMSQRAADSRLEVWAKKPKGKVYVKVPPEVFSTRWFYFAPMSVWKMRPSEEDPLGFPPLGGLIADERGETDQEAWEYPMLSKEQAWFQYRRFDPLTRFCFWWLRKRHGISAPRDSA